MDAACTCSLCLRPIRHSPKFFEVCHRILQTATTSSFFHTRAAQKGCREGTSFEGVPLANIMRKAEKKRKNAEARITSVGQPCRTFCESRSSICHRNRFCQRVSYSTCAARCMNESCVLCS